MKAKEKAEVEVVRQIHKQVTPTFAPDDDQIWAQIDLLEPDPAHRGIAMRNLRFKPFWLKAEADEWAGLWQKGVSRGPRELRRDPHPQQFGVWLFFLFSFLSLHFALCTLYFVHFILY